MSSSCLTLWPASACGIHGDCVNSTTCICEDGWSQTKEFSFFVEADQLDQSICNFNKGRGQAIYVISLITSSICLILQAHISLASRSRFKRSITWNLGILLVFLYSAYRVAKPTALYGFDVAFSFLIGNSLLFLANGSLVFFQRYVFYLTKSYPWATEYARIYAKQLHSLLYILMGTDLFTFQLFWIPALVTKNSVKLILLRSVVGYILVRYFIMFIFIYVLRLFIKDMENLLESTEMHQQIPGTSTISESSAGDNGNKLLVLIRKKELPRTKRYLRGTIIFVVFDFPVYFLPLIWDFWLQNWVYFLPLNFIPVSMIIFVFAFTFIMGRKKGTTMTTSRNTPDHLTSSKTSKDQPSSTHKIVSNSQSQLENQPSL